jgi:Starch-binding associating with outer membrane
MIFNKIKLTSRLVATVAILGLSACQSYFGDVNVDPHKPINASPSSLLLTSETRLIYNIWGDLSRFSSILTQHGDGNDRQFADYHKYNFVPGDFSTLWDNMYAGLMMDLKQLQALADAKGYNAYAGISRALQAHSMMLVADFFNDAPYSAAFDAEKTYQPTYDKQAAIYTAIFKLLDEARTKLAAAPGDLKPSATSDLIYAGSTAKWTKYCNVLAARAYLHLGKLDAGNYSKALAELAKGGFAANADDARLTFSGGTVGDAPWYQYNTQRGDIVTGVRYKAMFLANDPRKAIYGADLDDAHPIFKATQAVPLLTYTEQKFIEAECNLKIAAPNNTAARAAMLAGIQSSFVDAGAPATAYAPYIAQAAVNPVTDITMTHVMTQKYLALLADPEVFTDWRRTNLPALTPNFGNAVPRRFLYPQIELDLNTNTPKGTKVFDRVGWDVQ